MANNLNIDDISLGDDHMLLEDELFDKRLQLFDFLTDDERYMLKKINPKKEDITLDILLIINLINQFNPNSKNFFKKFNDRVFLNLIYKVCEELLEQTELLTYTDLKNMKKEELFNIYFYKSDTKNKVYIASPDIYKHMIQTRKSTTNGKFRLIDNEVLRIICNFLKIGSSEPNGFNESLWINIAKKLLNIEGIICHNTNEYQSYNTKLHNESLKERNEQRMEQANKGGSKSKKTLDNLTVKTLQQLCSKHKITYSGLRKADLIKKLNTYKIKP